MIVELCLWIASISLLIALIGKTHEVVELKKQLGMRKPECE